MDGVNGCIQFVNLGRMFDVVSEDDQFVYFGVVQDLVVFGGQLGVVDVEYQRVLYEEFYGLEISEVCCYGFQIVYIVLYLVERFKFWGGIVCLLMELVWCMEFCLEYRERRKENGVLGCCL